MATEDQLAERAVVEILEAVSVCESAEYSAKSRADLWEVFEGWLNDQRLLLGDSILRTTVLNELTFRLSDDRLKEGAWKIIRALARKYANDDPAGMGISLAISTFELFAEAPEVPVTVSLLFSLADDPETRWAVFAAYENNPSRLRSHAAMYSNGKITDADCDDWLCEQFLSEFGDLT